MSRLPLEQGRLRGCEFRHFLNAFRRVILDIVHRRTGPEIVSSYLLRWTQNQGTAGRFPILEHTSNERITSHLSPYFPSPYFPIFPGCCRRLSRQAVAVFERVNFPLTIKPTAN